jgi:hypothetical protein
LAAITTGTRFGPYEIVAPIGAGGMGEVWRGRDTRLDRSVAIKILPAAFANDAQLKLRFEREARAISQLNHPNICTLYDVGDSYLVMELLEGQSLADRLGRGPLPMNEVLRYGAQIAEALDRAHRAGIVHRDVKPGNVMITKSGAKLLDFGLAKSSGLTPSGVDMTEHKPLTQEGTLLGTFQYMAPEQLEGEEADARTDIFALGALLYEMATGARAFAGKTRTSLIASIVSQTPRPIHDIQPLTPPAFEHVVEKCLEKTRDDRWQSAHDVAEELKWIATSPASAPQRQKRGSIAWAAAAVAMAIAGYFAFRASRPQQLPLQYRFDIPTIDAAYKAGASPQLTADGRVLFFRATTTEGVVQVYRRPLTDTKATPIEGTLDCSGYIAAPDGRSVLAYFPGAIIKRIPVDGGPAQLVTNSATGQGPAIAFGANGALLVGVGTSPIRRILPDGKLEDVVTLDTAAGESTHESPFFLPDGEHFLFVAVHRDSEHGTLKRVLKAAKLGSKESVTIGEVPTRVECAMGHLFYVREGTLVAQPFDVAMLKISGDPIAVVDNVGFNARSGVAGFSVSESGTIAYHGFVTGIHATWLDASGHKLGVVGPNLPLFRGGFAVLPGDDRVVLPVFDLKAGYPSLWIYGLKRETATRVTYSAASETTPVATPDGSRLFYASDITQGVHIWETPIDGSTPPRLVVSETNNQLPTDVSPDGRYLIFMSNPHQAVSKQDLWLLPLQESGKPHPYLATPASETLGSFSHDGKWLAYQSDATGKFQIYVRPFPGPGIARIVSTKGGASARFSHDGRRILFADNGKLWAADFQTDGSIGEPRMLFDVGDRILAYHDFGDRYLMLLLNDADASPPMHIMTGWRPPA